MNLFHDVPFGDTTSFELNAIVEIPKWCKVKYEFNHTNWAIWVERVGRTPIPYTFNYGDLPQTWNEWDNDPLDVIILCSEELATGAVVPCRVVWGLKMIDSWEDDYKILAVADDKYYDWVKDIGDVNKMELEDIEYYMLHYKDLHWKKIELNGWDNRDVAITRLKDCHEAYKVKFSK